MNKEIKIKSNCIKQINNTEIKARNDMGGEIVITTSSLDRSRDRVPTDKMSIDSYLDSLIVVDNHRTGINYSVADAIIGKTLSLTKTQDQISQISQMSAIFKLNDAVNEFDKQNIRLMLWREGLLKNASIQFLPLSQPVPNDEGGVDYGVTELLEWSLVAIPDNPEATVARSFNRTSLDLAYGGVQKFGSMALDGIGERLKSGELSETVIKSMLEDLDKKKFALGAITTSGEDSKQMPMFAKRMRESDAEKAVDNPTVDNTEDSLKTGVVKKDISTEPKQNKPDNIINGKEQEVTMPEPKLKAVDVYGLINTGRLSPEQAKNVFEHDLGIEPEKAQSFADAEIIEVPEVVEEIPDATDGTDEDGEGKDKKEVVEEETDESPKMYSQQEFDEALAAKELELSDLQVLAEGALEIIEELGDNKNE